MTTRHATAFGTLIRCACGHSIGAHARAGCHGDPGVPCRCRITDATVLERAVAQAALEFRAATRGAGRQRAR
jgi:hypothetical protein